MDTLKNVGLVIAAVLVGLMVWNSYTLGGDAYRMQDMWEAAQRMVALDVPRNGRLVEPVQPARAQDVFVVQGGANFGGVLVRPGRHEEVLANEVGAAAGGQ